MINVLIKYATIIHKIKGERKDMIPVKCFIKFGNFLFTTCFFMEKADLDLCGDDTR